MISVNGGLFEDDGEIRDQAVILYSNLLQSSTSITEEGFFQMAGPFVTT